MRTSARGFALIELVLVLAVLGVLLFVVMSQGALQSKPSGNAQRRADVNSLLTALEIYSENHQGNLPEGITATPKTIASAQDANMVNLCAALVPSLLTTMPLDPSVGSAIPAGAKCSDKNARYNTGYTVEAPFARKIIVSAPAAEGGETIFASN